MAARNVVVIEIFVWMSAVYILKLILFRFTINKWRKSPYDSVFQGDELSELR